MKTITRILRPISAGFSILAGIILVVCDKDILSYMSYPGHVHDKNIANFLIGLSLISFCCSFLGEVLPQKKTFRRISVCGFMTLIIIMVISGKYFPNDFLFFNSIFLVALATRISAEIVSMLKSTLEIGKVDFSGIKF